MGWLRRRPRQTRGDGALLNSRDIAALNRARSVLKRLEDAAWRQSLSHFDPYAPVTAWDLGRLSEAASLADDAILHVLSTARHNCQLPITDAQLLGAEPAQGQVRATRALKAVPRADGPAPSTGSSSARKSRGQRGRTQDSARAR
jgi:hypothetical protein